MSRLALLVPAHNAAPFLGRLLESARAQTSPFDEIRVFDDASDDGTGDLARRFGASVVRSGIRQGPSAGKNLLAATTACDWVHFHDADDALEPDFVRRARGWMAGGEADVVLFATEDRDDASGRPLDVRTWDDGALRADAVAYAIRHTITNCGVYRRNRFVEAGGFLEAEAFKFSEDQAMHLQLALAGLRFRADPYPGVVIYRRQHSMSSGDPVACARSQVNVLAHAVAATGRRYSGEVRARAWHLASVAASYSDWRYARRSLALARVAGGPVPPGEHWLVRAVGTVAPAFAVIGREAFIRMFKPRLRRHRPRAAVDERAVTASGPMGSR